MAEEEPRVVRHDRFDDLAWQGTLHESGALRALRDKGRALYGGFGGLLADLFAGLYKLDPRLVPEEENQARWQRETVRKSWETETWQQTREGSVLDELLSALGTLAAGEAILKELEETEKSKTASGAGSQGTRGASGNAAGRPGSDTGKGSPPTPAAGDETSGTPEANPRAVARAVSGAAHREVAQTQQALAAWGIEPSELQHLPLNRRIELARTLARNAGMRRLAEMIGAMRALAAGVHRTRLTAKPGAAVSVETGSDPQRLLPHELALLGHPAGRAEGMRRLATRSALLWRTARRERAGRGPLIALCDASGSTRAALAPGLTVEGMIRAVALGLGEIASRQRRAWAGVVFSERGRFVTFEAPGGRLKPEALLGFATATYGGGTDWETPLREALRLCRQAAFRDADVVLITDGICRLPAECTAELNTYRAETGTRVVGVLVGNHPDTALRTFCDRIVKTADLHAAAEEIMRAVAEDRPGGKVGESS